MKNFQNVFLKYPERLMLLDCKYFLKEPELTLKKISNFFNFEYEPNHLKSVVEGQLFSYNSKFNDQTYSPEIRTRENIKVAQENQKTLEIIHQWSLPFLKLAHLHEFSQGSFLQSLRGRT